MKEKAKQIVCYGFMIGCIVAIIFMIGILIYTTSFSVFVEDDFSVINIIAGQNYSVLSYLGAAIADAIRIYNAWQGTYFGSFLITAINPIPFGGLTQLRWTMAFNCLFFFASLLLLLVNVLQKMKLNSKVVSLAIITCIVFSMCGYETYPEIFFWFTGAMMYSVPFSFMLLGIDQFIRLSNTKRNLLVAFSASVLGLAGMGGALVIAGTGCYVILLHLLFDWFVKKEVNKYKIIVFLVWVFGALINAIAPGNFVRRAYTYDPELHLMNAIKNSFIVTYYRWHTLLGYNYLLIILIVFVCAIATSRISTIDHKVTLFSFWGLFTPVVAAFPFALGTDATIPPNRCAFIFDVVIILSSVLFTFCFTNLVLGDETNRVKRFIILTSLVAMLFCCKFDHYEISDFKTFELTQLHRDGVFESHYHAHERFYDWLRTQTGEDVIVDPAHCPYGIDNVHNLILSVDPNHWVNKLISRYCGVNSIKTDYD